MRFCGGHPRRCGESERPMYWHANSADEHDQKFRPRGTTICLLDDDPSILKAVSRMLSCAGWHAQSFIDPMAFLDYARDQRPRLAVLDMLMPMMNGLEVQARLRDVSPSTGVIVVTSNDDPGVCFKAMNAGATAFFLKPLDQSEFLAAIASAFASQARS